MFLLGQSEFPKEAATLVASIGEGLRPLGLGAERVSAEGSLPALALLRCDLSGAVFQPEHRAAIATGALEPGFFARHTEAVCTHARFGEISFSGSLQIDDAVFGFGRDAAGQAVLALERCGNGTLDLAIARTEVEKAVFGLASKAAEEQGAEVKSVTVRWESRGPRALELRVVARAKAMFVETSVTATGRVEITEALTLVISGLACSGDGMMGNLAATFLRKEIPKYEGRSVSLAGAFGGLRLREVTLKCEDEVLRVRAVV